MKIKILLFIVLALSIFLRLYKLDVVPPSLNWDEVSHGYNAYSILKTGKDEWGKFFPLIFRAFGDYKLPVYIYLTVPMVKLFGLSAYGVRMVSVLFGIGSVLFVYFLSNELFKQKRLSLVSALVMAVSPWSVFLSRIAVEANLSVFFIVSGVYYFLFGIRQKKEEKSKAWGFALSGLLLGLSLFTYNSARVFIPILLGLLVWIYKENLYFGNSKKTKGQKKFSNVSKGTKISDKDSLNCSCHLVGLAIFLLFFSGVVYQSVLPSGQARFNNISILDSGSIARINEARGKSELPSLIPKIIYNKGTYLIVESVENYFSYFNPKFWFVRGGSHYQFSVPNYPLIYPINGFLLLVGLFAVIKASFYNKRSFISKRTAWLIVGWLLLAPIPASPTRDNPHVLRIVTIMPMMYVLIGLGFYQLKLKLKIKKYKLKIVLLVIYVLILGWSLSDFWQKYTINYRQEYAWAWQDGYKEAIQLIKSRYDKYDRIFITKRYGEPHEFIAFYWPWDPKDFQRDKQWNYHANWYWVNKLDKFIFINDWEIKKRVTCNIDNEACLLVSSPGNAPDRWKRLKTVYNLNKKAVFELYEKM